MVPSKRIKKATKIAPEIKTISEAKKNKNLVILVRFKKDRLIFYYKNFLRTLLHI